MKKILVFSFFPAYVPPSNGGESRLFNFYKSLSRFHQVTLLTSSHLNADEERIYHGSNFIERRIPKDHNFSLKWKELESYSSGGDMSAVCITACGKSPTLMHDAYLEEYVDADIIIHDSPFTVDYDLFFLLDDKIRVYNSYNCETVLYKALHPQKKSTPIIDLISNAEIKLLEGSDVVLYCNEDDVTAFREMAPRSDFVEIFAPNGVGPLLRSVRQTKKNKVDNVVFVGSGHPPNTKAALLIAQEIAPSLPGIMFHVVGSCLPKGKYVENVVRHGFLDNDEKEKIIRASDLALNPMQEGSGSNVKVFDFMSHSLPVLSTEFGLRGIHAEHGYNCLIAPVSEFVEVIKAWSSRYDELKAIGINGQKMASEHYSWDVIAENVYEELKNVKRTVRWQEKFVLALNDYDSYDSTGGGGVRTRGIYAAINEWSPVVFLCFSDKGELAVRAENENTIVFNIPKTGRHIDELQYLNSYSHVSVADIVACRHCLSDKLLVSIYNICKKLSRNIVVEHPYMARLPAFYKDRFVYSSQNNETQIKKSLLEGHPFYEELIKDVEYIEKIAVELSSAVIAVSDADARSFVNGVTTAAPVIVVNNGAASPVMPDEAEFSKVKRQIEYDKSVVFVGSAHAPNIDAVKYIINVLAPASPTVDFHIIGTVCSVFSPDMTDNIRLWGVLSESEKSAVMQSCSVALNTVISGGGSNIKLADYYANGLFVVTTPFGLRGYPPEINNHLIVAEITEFPGAIQTALEFVKSENGAGVAVRKEIFSKYLSMTSLAKDVVRLLKNQERSKKKVLFVTYRYTDPVLGGGESMLGSLIEAMDKTDDFQIDVVSPEISGMTNINRFSENYKYDGDMGAKVGLNNTRFARFPVVNDINVSDKVAKAWLAQPLFEKEAFLQIKDKCYTDGLAWGWGDPEGGALVSRWAFVSCGLFFAKATKVHMCCYAPQVSVIWVKTSDGELIKTQQIDGRVELEFHAPASIVEITTSTAFLGNGDLRPLAFQVLEMRFNEMNFDLSQPLLVNVCELEDEQKFRVLDNANAVVREQLKINLSDMRGPFSPALEKYLDRNIGEYDLLVTHNNIFRTAVVAVDKAKEYGVPVVSIPHAHLDDDYYHFPDVHQSVLRSDLVMAAPKIACDFYAEKGANVTYLPAGINTREAFTDADINAFRNVFNIQKPFVLVLGRKSIAKGYMKVIKAVEQVSVDTEVGVVIIGPDDDNLPVTSSVATYLGRQSRQVIRGALLSCKALVNMSSSESFGIVLLEAWMAGKPVVVNKACAAFHDLAKDGINAIMVSTELSLQDAIRKIVSDEVYAKQLADCGKDSLISYDWSQVGQSFVAGCNETINKYTRR